jgi:hypothetical protein
MYLVKVISKTNYKKENFFFGILEVSDEKSWNGSGSVNQMYISKDPDP